MLGRKDRRRNVFDEDIVARMIRRDHPRVAIKPPVDFGVVEETVRPLYTVETGRTRYPPATLLCIRFREIVAPLSEGQVVDTATTSCIATSATSVATTPCRRTRRSSCAGAGWARPGSARASRGGVEAARQHGLLQGE